MKSSFFGTRDLSGALVQCDQRRQPTNAKCLTKEHLFSEAHSFWSSQRCVPHSAHKAPAGAEMQTCMT